MTFHFIQPESRPFLTTPPAEATPRPPGNARRQLDRDYRRWTRLLVGCVGLVLAAFGAVAVIGIPFSGVRLTALDITMTIVGAVVGGLGIWMLVRLHRSGRALLKALAWWTAEPYRTGTARPSGSGWVGARTVNFEPPIFARIATSSLLGLFGLLAVATVAYPTPPGAANLTPAAVSVGIVLLATAIGQLGGVMRLVSGLAVADPLWVRIRNAFRRG